MTDPRPASDLRRLGDTGLQRVGGIIQEEWLPELRGAKGRRVIRQMVDQDPIIGGILFAIEMLLRRTTWEIRPAGDTPEDEAAAAFVGEAFGALRPAWLATLPELLSFLPWGWAVLEICYRADERGRTVWDAWEIRAQDTLERWEFDATGRPTAMVQAVPNTTRAARIPLEKALHLTTTSRKGNPEGRPLLRNAYRPWYFKSRIENIEGVGVERDLAGLPVAFVPPELLASNLTAEDQAVYDKIVEIVTNIRRDEQEGVVWPLEYDARGNKVYDLQLLSSGGRRQFDTGGIIARYGSQIAMSVLADFILLGHEQVGSFALAADKTELFTVALGAWLDSISSAVETQACARLLALNGMPGAVTLAHGSVEQADLGVLGSYLASLVGAGATLFPNDQLLVHLLKEAGLPTDEAAIKAAREEAAAARAAAAPTPPPATSGDDTP